MESRLLDFSDSLYDQRDIEQELDFITHTRRHLATILQSLALTDFDRIGHHSEAGPLTLRQLLENVTNHIPHHVQFIQQKRNAL